MRIEHERKKKVGDSFIFINTLNEKKNMKALRCVEKSIINSVFIVFFFVLLFGVKSLDKERKSLVPNFFNLFLIKPIM